MSKKIKLAKTAGFCYGVKRAVETTKKLKTDNESQNVYVLGELIHNSHVIRELDRLGIKTVDEIPSNSQGVCVVRSHGASPATFKEIADSDLQIMDLTCPDVKKVQKKAIELAQDGYLTIIVGKADHPEVKAIKDNALEFSKSVYVISGAKEIEKIENEIHEQKKVGVVVQTTQMINTLNEIVEKLVPISKELKVFNTICASTSKRQREAKELAHQSDLMIVVGSKKSANTTHLAQIVSDITKTIHIEDVKDIPAYINEIKKSENIGVTAGASTPDNIINEVINAIKNI